MSERKTALEGFRMLAFFIAGEAWRAPEVERETGWSRTKVFGMLETAVKAGYLEKRREGMEVRYRLSEPFREALAKGLGRAALRDADSVVRTRADEAARAVRTQMEHLVNELREVLK